MTCYLYNISADGRQLIKVDNSTPYTEARTAVKPTAPLDILSYLTIQRRRLLAIIFIVVSLGGFTL